MGRSGVYGQGRNRVTLGATVLPIAEENICRAINDRVDYCQIVVGRVIIDITSRLKMLGLGDNSYEQLTEAALAHLREAVPGVD